MSGKRSRAFRAFQKVKTLKPNRSLFDLSHEWLATADMGKLYPCMYMEMSPGDTFHVAKEIVTRMQPLNAPILHAINLYTHTFFVPYRLLDENWTQFITGGDEGQYGGTARGESAEPSELSPALPRWNPTENGVGSLWDYFGLPVGVNPVGALPLAYLKRAYNLVWNEYYRDENLQEEVDLDSEKILKRNWRKDYFTSALESRQRGVAPALPVGGTVTMDYEVESHQIEVPFVSTIEAFNGYGVNFDLNLPVSQYGVVYGSYSASDIDSTSWDNNPPYYQCSVSSQLANVDGVAVNHIHIYFLYETQSPKPSFDGSSRVWIRFNFHKDVANFENGVGATVTDLRQVFQIQKWMELANRGGVRYTEFLRSFFGVSPRDDRLQRPEYVGGTKSGIVVSEVLQTSSTDNEPTPQGNMAGHGISASRTYEGSYTATEYGIMISLLSIMPETKYTQGINRQWLRRTKFDFLFPQFTGLSEQAIEEAEIYATDDEDENRRIFGFNEIYDELRAIPSKIVGKMRTVFNYWHLAREFDSAPALNSDFIECNPSKRIFAVPSEDGFIVNVANIVRAVRPLPKYGTPRGV